MIIHDFFHCTLLARLGWTAPSPASRPLHAHLAGFEPLTAQCLFVDSKLNPNPPKEGRRVGVLKRQEGAPALLG